MLIQKAFFKKCLIGIGKICYLFPSSNILVYFPTLSQTLKKNLGLHITNNT